MSTCIACGEREGSVLWVRAAPENESNSAIAAEASSPATAEREAPPMLCEACAARLSSRPDLLREALAAGSPPRALEPWQRWEAWAAFAASLPLEMPLQEKHERYLRHLRTQGALLEASDPEAPA